MKCFDCVVRSAVTCIGAIYEKLGRMVIWIYHNFAIVSKCLNIKLEGIIFTEKGNNHGWFSFHLVFSQAGGSYQETVQTLIKAMKNAEVSKALIYSFHCSNIQSTIWYK